MRGREDLRLILKNQVAETELVGCNAVFFSRVYGARSKGSSTCKRQGRTPEVLQFTVIFTQKRAKLVLLPFGPEAVISVAALQVTIEDQLDLQWNVM